MKNITPYRVIYGDTDQMGVAYYANYLRWFEIGRTEFMREAGFPYEQAEREGIFFPVTEVQCRYRRPALYDNLLRIETTVESLSPVALRFNYRIGLEGEPVTLASGWTKHACLNRDRKLTRLPEPYAGRLGLESTLIGAGPSRGRRDRVGAQLPAGMDVGGAEGLRHLPQQRDIVRMTRHVRRHPAPYGPADE